ncbi:MAG TPA: glycosyltransferase family 39 protein [Tepidisphaeraceae bacterium]|jgi:4-amino-4-deoxy-L-arabinose transferase-like glycosyltransferase
MSLRIWIVTLLCGALYLVGNGRTSLWDRDEPRYAQASRQMLQSGDWVVPRLLDEPRINKPPLIYWCQAASMAAFERVWPDDRLTIEGRMERDAAAARFPSAVAMVLTLILIGVVVSRLAGPERAFWTTLVFGTSGLVIMAAKMCLTDAVLLLFVTAGQFCVYAMYRGRGTWPIVIAFAIATGLGLLTKGPVVLGVNGMTLLVLGVLGVIDRRVALASSQSLPVASAPPASASRVTLDYQARDGRPARPWLSSFIKFIVALAIILAIGLPWVLTMNHRLPGGLAGTFRHDVLQRMTQPLEQHKGPPGYYLLFFFASFFPWSLLLPTAIVLAWRNRREPLIRFAFAAVVGPWIMFELIRTKLPHYVLPCFPFLAILTADAIVRAIREEHAEWTKRGWMVAVGVFCVVLALLGAAPWAATETFWKILAAVGISRSSVPGQPLGFDRLPYPAMTVVSIVACVFALGIFVNFARRQIARAALSMAAAMFALIPLLFAWYLPSARFLHLSEEVGAYLQSVGATTRGDVSEIDYKEDSLPFYQGGTIRPQPKNAYLAAEPPEHWPTYLTITREIWNQTPDSAKAHLEVLKTFRGWAYAAKGRVVDVMVVRKR